MPEFAAYRRFLAQANWDVFKPVDERLLTAADQALSRDLPALINRAQYLAQHPEEAAAEAAAKEAEKKANAESNNTKWF